MEHHKKNKMQTGNFARALGKAKAIGKAKGRPAKAIQEERSSTPVTRNDGYR
jgi:hypothetical protein